MEKINNNKEEPENLITVQDNNTLNLKEIKEEESRDNENIINNTEDNTEEKINDKISKIKEKNYSYYLQFEQLKKANYILKKNYEQLVGEYKKIKAQTYKLDHQSTNNKLKNIKESDKLNSKIQKCIQEDKTQGMELDGLDEYMLRKVIYMLF